VKLKTEFHASIIKRNGKSPGKEKRPLQCYDNKSLLYTTTYTHFTNILSRTEKISSNTHYYPIRNYYRRAYFVCDRCCGLVVSVPGSDPEVPGSIPGATIFYKM
jgi:hypothetical protein